MEVLYSACAFVWHVGDAMIGSSKGHKNLKRLFAGVGVGWSAFFLARNIYKYYTQQQLVTTKPRE